MFLLAWPSLTHTCSLSLPPFSFSTRHVRTVAWSLVWHSGLSTLSAALLSFLENSDIDIVGNRTNVRYSRGAFCANTNLLVGHRKHESRWPSGKGVRLEIEWALPAQVQTLLVTPFCFQQTPHFLGNQNRGFAPWPLMLSTRYV